MAGLSNGIKSRAELWCPPAKQVWFAGVFFEFLPAVLFYSFYNKTIDKVNLL